MSRGDIDRRLATPDPEIRCYLFHGPDDAGSRALASRIATALGPGAERVDLTPAQLKGDPAALADEAAAGSLFGAVRWIRVDGAGDECLGAVEALMRAPVSGNPVVLIAGALKKDSRLLKLLESEPNALVAASYPPNASDLARLAASAAGAIGLRIDDDLARRLAGTCGGDRAVMTREIEKLADYADATPATPRQGTEAMLDAVGADRSEADLGATIDALCAGDLRALEAALASIGAEGGEPIPLVRAASRRFIAMAAVRAEIDRGSNPRAAGDRAARTLFWRERESVVRDAPRWPAATIALAIDRLGALERTLKSGRGAGAAALDQLFFAMARGVRR